MPLENMVETDVLVIGGGMAGCFAAIQARERGLDVTIVDKAYSGKAGSSIFANGWLAFNTDWGHDLNVAMHTASTRGEYINNREWTEIILKESWAAHQDLASWGVEFHVEAGEEEEHPINPPNSGWGGIFTQSREAMLATRKQAEKVGVKIMDRIMVTDLMKQGEEVIGAIGFALDSGDLYIFKAKATVLSGGNNCFRSPGYHTDSLTGDADGIAYRAGAEITGKEFPDFHFSLASYPAWTMPAYAIYYFTDAEGKNIDDPCYGMELPMAFSIHAGKGPISHNLNVSPDEELKATQEFIQSVGNPRLFERIDLDVTRRGKHPIVGGASAGRSCEQSAGIWVINKKCASSLPGLYAAGDCCGIYPGGSILLAGGWSIAGAAVTGKRAGGGAAEYALQKKGPAIDEENLAILKRTVYSPTERAGGFSPRWVTQLLQNIMMPYFILHIKHGERLQAALTMVEFLRDHHVPKLTAKDAHELRLAHETKNMVLNAEMILRSSLFRTESRGRHYREDYPRRDDPAWLAWVKFKEEQGGMKLWKEPVPKEWWPDLSKPYEERYPRRFPGE